MLQRDSDCVIAPSGVFGQALLIIVVV